MLSYKCHSRVHLQHRVCIVSQILSFVKIRINYIFYWLTDRNLSRPRTHRSLRSSLASELAVYWTFNSRAEIFGFGCGVIFITMGLASPNVVSSLSLRMGLSWLHFPIMRSNCVRYAFNIVPLRCVSFFVHPASVGVEQVNQNVSFSVEWEMTSHTCLTSAGSITLCRRGSVE